MNELDNTEKFKIGEIDNDLLEIQKCACGAEFNNWNFVISNNKQFPDNCPKCDRKFYFTNKITIYEVI